MGILTSQKATPDLYVSFLIGVSFFTLFLFGMIAFSPPVIQENFPWRPPIIGLIYTLVCLLGMLAVFFPRRCSRLFNHENRTIDTRKLRDSSNSKRATQDTSLVFGLEIVHGHHPRCEDFSDHEIRIGNKTFCAGCLGLSFGALVSLAVTGLYFFGGWQIGKGSFLAVVTGILAVAFGLLQLPTIRIRGLPRLVPNVFLVIGTTLILIGVDALGNSVFLDSFLLVSSIFWLWTKMSISHRDHMRICKACGFECSR